MKIPLLIILFSFLGFLHACDNNKELFSRKEIADDVYLEKYYSFQGGVFGDVLAIYLTDSVSFRTFVMKKEDKEHVYYEFIDSSRVAFVKRSRRSIDYDSILDSIVFSIVKLKSEGKFDK